MRIDTLEEKLNARHTGCYPSGHTGAHILRFRRHDNNVALVVKCAPDGNEMAAAEVAANLAGYRSMAAVGGQELLPPDLDQITIVDPDGKEEVALVMRDLDLPLSAIANQGPWVDVLLAHFKRVVLTTACYQRHSNNQASVRSCLEEVVFHLHAFPCVQTERIVDKIQRHATPFTDSDKLALMLLDFTPDNLFLSTERLSFVDPWAQSTFLGHPAVSLGQLAILVRLYGLKGDPRAIKALCDFCVRELQSVLDCSFEATRFAWRLGQSLQLALSANVRIESDPYQSNKLGELAVALWR